MLKETNAVIRRIFYGVLRDWDEALSNVRPNTIRLDNTEQFSNRLNHFQILKETVNLLNDFWTVQFEVKLTNGQIGQITVEKDSNFAVISGVSIKALKDSEEKPEILIRLNSGNYSLNPAQIKELNTLSFLQAAAKE